MLQLEMPLIDWWNIKQLEITREIDKIGHKTDKKVDINSIPGVTSSIMVSERKPGGVNSGCPTSVSR